MADLIDYLMGNSITADRNSKLSAWAQQAYGDNNPTLAALGQADPETLRGLLPDLIKHQQEQEALKQLYPSQEPTPAPQPQPFGEGNNGDQLPSAPVPQTLPSDNGSALGALSQQQAPAQKAPSALQRMASALPYLPPALQTIVGQQMMMQASGGDAGPNGGATGDEFLKSLSPVMASQVKALTEGRIPYPTQAGLKSPQVQMLLQAANQYDPSFDASTWQQRSKTAADFNATGGKSRQNITAIETALNHLSSLQDANEKLGGWAVGNTIKNSALSAISDPDLTRYNQIAKTAADEVAKATAGPGGSTLADREERLKGFTADQSPHARQVAIQSAIELLNGRLEPMAEGYNNAMGTAKRPTELLSPHAQSAYSRIMGVPSDNVTASGNYNPAQDQPAQSALSQIAAPNSGYGYSSQVQAAPLSGAASPQMSLQDAARAELARRKKGK